MTSNEKLISLAKFTRRFHLLLFAFGAMMWPLFFVPSSGSTLEKVGRVGMIYVGGLIVGTVLGKLIFSGDCPLTILEFCLRGLGGEKFPHSRLYTMAELDGTGMVAPDIYKRLLRRSSVYTLFVGVVIIITTIWAAVAF